ncbi:uncharacterized protein LOC129232982, partial [Uloborus diversus]|uniref:uncharacterized protein LOC129232982 n=1 Tax=Uloborus diversus TaxID=327109 RepID=UPI002409504C
EFTKVPKNKSTNDACSSGLSQLTKKKRKNSLKIFPKEAFENSKGINDINTELKEKFPDGHGTKAKVVGKRKQVSDDHCESNSNKKKSSESDINKSNIKKQKRVRKKKNIKHILGDGEGQFDEASEIKCLENSVEENVGKKCSDKKTFISKAEEKLQAAKFRYLNEMLYTETGNNAFEYFQKNRRDFMNYHSGYRSQVLKWPINPVDVIIKDIQKLSPNTIIADLGCGDAKISQNFPDRTVHSFDIIALNKNIIACDISHTPLADESVDVAVFCLSLMGTNLKDFLCEAHRILKLQGILKIAEVESRIEDKAHFVKCVELFGFMLKKENTCSKMFVFLDFIKVKKKMKKSKAPNIALKPCLYKKR